MLDRILNTALANVVLINKSKQRKMYINKSRRREVYPSSTQLNTSQTNVLYTFNLGGVFTVVDIIAIFIHFMKYCARYHQLTHLVKCLTYFISFSNEIIHLQMKSKFRCREFFLIISSSTSNLARIFEITFVRIQNYFHCQNYTETFLQRAPLYNGHFSQKRMK